MLLYVVIFLNNLRACVICDVLNCQDCMQSTMRIRVTVIINNNNNSYVINMIIVNNIIYCIA